jgi:hypothetical protein
MASILHICLRTDDLVDQVIAQHREQADLRVIVVELNQADPDYDTLVSAIFAADHIAVWT